MDEIYIKSIKNKISEKLINSDFDPFYKGENEVVFGNKQLMFEQYKLLVDSAHKIEERRGGSNNIFLGINTLLASFLVRPAELTNMQTKDMPILISLTLIGVFISWEWLNVTASYKKLNFINFCLLNVFEKFFPTYVFSLRGETEAEQEKEKPVSRANIILIKENLLPKAFMLLYFIYFLTILFYTLK